MYRYYFVGTALPDLRIDEPPEIHLKDYERLLSDNLSNSDMAKVNTVRNFYDIYNLLSYWKGEPFDPAGSLNANDLEEALATRTGLPPYIFDYLDKYETKEERLRHFPALLQTFFNEEIAKASGFFKTCLQMERETRLILVALRAKKMGRDLLTELQYEDPESDFIAQMIAQKDAPQYEPPEEYKEIKDILTRYEDKPLELEKAMIEFRFKKIQELLGDQLFTMDRILGYLIQLIMIEKWNQLDKQKGKAIIDTMLKDAS